LLGLGACIQIETDADVTYPAKICINYTPEDIEDLPEGFEEYLVLFHVDAAGNTTPMDCVPPIPVNTVEKLVCGCTDSFSTFGVGYPCNSAVGDFNKDGDVDGSDIVRFLINSWDVELMSLANNFGLDNGPECGTQPEPE